MSNMPATIHHTSASISLIKHVVRICSKKSVLEQTVKRENLCTIAIVSAATVVQVPGSGDEEEIAVGRVTPFAAAIVEDPDTTEQYVLTFHFPNVGEYLETNRYNFSEVLADLTMTCYVEGHQDGRW